MPHGLIVSNAAVDWLFPHAGADTPSVFRLQASRAWRIDARESPGGDGSDAIDAAPTGVAGTVSNAVPPKRHLRPSAAEESEELSSEALVLPRSVICSLSLRSALSAGPASSCSGLSAVEADDSATEAEELQGSASSVAAPAMRLLFNSTASSLSRAAPDLAACMNASRAACLFAERSAGGVIGAPHGLIVNIGEAEVATAGFW